MLNIRCYYSSKSRFTFSDKNHSEETKYKISIALKGVPKPSRTAEHSAKISVALKGVPKSEETKAKQSAAVKGKPSSNKGNPRSEETKAKISAAMKGKKRGPRTPEQNAANSARQKGVLKPKFFSIIKTKKTYTKANLSKLYPEFKQYY